MTMGKPLDVAGKTFGRLTAVRHSHDEYTSGGKIRPVWVFSCSCGNTHVGRVYSVTAGSTKSCGCLSRESTITRHTRHGCAAGHNLTPEYRTWRNMLTRGRNPNIRNAERYVLRGITVAAEWLPGGDDLGFERFLAHVGLKPSPAHSLDRIDNDRGYEPGNVRWATQQDQVLNRAMTKRFWVNGESLTLSEIERRYGIRQHALRDRLFKLGWSIEAAISTPLRKDRRRAA